MIAEEPSTSTPTINESATPVPSTPESQSSQSPMLTLATSLTDRPNIARGFDIKKEDENKSNNSIK